MKFLQMAGQEEDEGLDALIKQKISRPSFARVISHELTRSPDDVKQSKITISRILKQLRVILSSSYSQVNKLLQAFKEYILKLSQKSHLVPSG